jgi:hypothetical protein
MTLEEVSRKNVIRRLIEQGDLEKYIRDVRHEMFLEERDHFIKNGDHENSLWYSFCVSDYTDCNQCGYMWDKNYRIASHLVQGPGKYLKVTCPNCGEIRTLKRDSWWEDSPLDQKVRGYEGTYVVRDFFDLTPYYLG